MLWLSLLLLPAAVSVPTASQQPQRQRYTQQRRQHAVPGEPNPFAGLPALKKTYYSDPEARDFNLTDPVISDYARIVGSLTLDVEFDRWAQGGQRVANAVEIVARVNGSLALYWTPWLFREPGAVPPAPGVTPLPRPFPVHAPPTYTGPEEEVELAGFTQRVTNLSVTIAQVNARLGTSVKITAVLLDQERFNVNQSEPLSSAWNLAIDRSE